jgi:hypothetical protein
MTPQIPSQIIAKFEKEAEEYAVRVTLMKSIFENIKEVGIDDTLDWLKSRFEYETKYLRDFEANKEGEK